MDWTQVDILTVPEGIDPLCGSLLSIGVTGFAIEDPRDFDEFLAHKTGNWDYVDEELLKLRHGDARVTVYLPGGGQGADMLHSLRTLVEELRARDPEPFGALTLTLSQIREEDWAHNWKQYFKPFPVGERLLMKPSWEDAPADASERLVLEIDPASSFGTGQHHSTQLCLRALEHVVQPGDRVLDMGCGSGILFIGALLLGADCAVGVDIEEHAVATAAENASRNGIASARIRTLCGNILEDASLSKEIGEGFDVVTANIVADVIIGMAAFLESSLRPGGTLISSGIIDSRADEVREALSQAGFTDFSIEEQEGWVGITASKMLDKD